MRAEEVAESIGWEFVERCAGGEFGAHLVRRGDKKAILKVAQHARAFVSIRNGAELADRARANGQLVPRFLAVEEWGDTGYTLQEFVEGDVPMRLSLPLAQRMIELLDTHIDVAADWPADKPAGFGDWWAEANTFASAPGHIRALSEEVIQVRDRSRGTALGTTDVAHDDYHHKNLLVRDGVIVAIIDWDGAQPGDRWYDAFKLMWWSQAAHKRLRAKCRGVASFPRRGKPHGGATPLVRRGPRDRPTRVLPARLRRRTGRVDLRIGADLPDALLEVEMPITIGFNHVATLTTDMDLTVGFYETVFGGEVTFVMQKTDDHPYMKIVDLGGGAALNVFEAAPEEIIGERRKQGGRGAIDHFALAVDNKATLEDVQRRLRDSNAQEVGEIQQLGAEWSLFFRDPDGMELEVCCPAD